MNNGNVCLTKAQMRRRWWESLTIGKRREINNRSRQKMLAKDPDFYRKLDRERYKRRRADPEKWRKVLAAGKKYREKYRHRDMARKVTYNAARYNADPKFKLITQLRSRLTCALAGKLKHGNTFALVGCSRQLLLDHIESQFEPGMTWANYAAKPGCWVLDHKVPVAAHDMSTLEGQKAAFSWQNLSPMWFEKNATKSSYYNGKKWIGGKAAKVDRSILREGSETGRLSKEQAIEIKELIKTRLFTGRLIGRFFDISEQQVCSIKKGRAWRWLKLPVALLPSCPTTPTPATLTP